MAERTVAFVTLPAVIRFAVRASGSAVDAIGGAFGIPLPRDACRATTNGARSALWLGPDEWLLIAPDGEGPALVALMTGALGGAAASVVEVSDRNVAVEVGGPKAAEAINAFNALDLHADTFQVGMCTRTLFGKAEIVLWRTADHTFRIEVWRSFGPYVLGCLEEAAREYG